MRCDLYSLRSPTLLVALLLVFPLSGLARGDTRHVLVLSSSERPVAPHSGFADALVGDLIRSSRESIQFVQAAVQAARDTEAEPGRAVAQRIRSAFGAARLDLVITIGGPAATFAQQYHHEVFPATPMLFAGVDRRFVENGRFANDETAVATEHDPALMIDEILRLLPETRSVMVVIGASPLEQFWLQRMKHEFSRFGDRVQFSWTNELSFDAIKERSRTMPARSAILFALLSVDGKGEPRVDGDTLTLLRAVANAPLFALYGMGHGIVGGPLLSTADLSRTTAQVALRLLAGEFPGSSKTPVQRAGKPTYDARELRRWHIDERRLPPASVVLFREPTIWQRNRGALAIGALLAGTPLAILLIVGITKQRRAQGQRFDRSLGLTSLPTDPTVRVWTAGPHGQRVEAGHASAVSPHSSWTAFVHPEDVERCADTFKRALERRETFQLEYRVREPGGQERWLLDTGLVRFSGDAFAGYIGSTVDITTVGRARAELSNLSRQLMQEYERERSALAKTLKEDVAQRMVALTLRMHSLKATADAAEVADIRDSLASLVGEVAAAPDPIYGRLDLLGLAATGRRFCQELSARHDVVIHFHDEGVFSNMTFDIAMAVFRVLQEATVNAVVHSQSREVWVTVRGSAPEIRLQIVDRGIGFDLERLAPTAGVGLVAMRERLKLVNGGARILSRPGEGTKLEAWVPLQPEV